MPISLTEDKKILPIQPDNQRANQAVLAGAKKFGTSVLNKAAAALAYPGQVVAGTFNQAATGIQNLPQAMKDYDARRGEEMRADLDQSAIEGKSPFPTPLNNQALRAEKAIAAQGGQGGGIPKLPAGNQDALNGINQTAPPVRLAETGTEQPGFVSPEEIANKQVTQETAQGILPGNSFDTANTAGYFKETGYMSDNDPRMIQRRKEAEDVQARRERFIANSEAGKYDLGSSPSFGGFKGELKGPALSSPYDNNARVGSKEYIQNRVNIKNRLKGDEINQRANSTKLNYQLGQQELAGSNRKALAAERAVNADNQIAREANQIKRDYYTGANMNDAARIQAGLMKGSRVKEPSPSDKIKSYEEKTNFINNYSLGDRSLPPQIGELVYNLGTGSGGSIADVESVVQQVINQYPDADFNNNPTELVSQVRSALRDSGYKL